MAAGFGFGQGLQPLQEAQFAWRGEHAQNASGVSEVLGPRTSLYSLAAAEVLDVLLQ